MELKHWFFYSTIIFGLLGISQGSYAAQSTLTSGKYHHPLGLIESKETYKIEAPSTSKAYSKASIPLFTDEYATLEDYWFNDFSNLGDDSEVVFTENLILFISKRIENDKDFIISVTREHYDPVKNQEVKASKDDTELSKESELDEIQLDKGKHAEQKQATGFGNLINFGLYSGTGFPSTISIGKYLEIPPLDKTQEESIQASQQFSAPNIEVYTNKRVEAFIRLYTVRKRYIFEKALERIPAYQTMISRILEEYELPQNLIYLAIVESNLNPKALSHASALGLWQFMSYTGKYYGLSRSWWHDDRYDPEKSTIAAAKYLKRLHKRFNGDWELALAAYNSGGGTVRKAIRRAKRNGQATDFWSLRLPRETRGYVPAFMAVSIIFGNLEKYGFQPVKPSLPEQPYQWLDVGGGLSLKEVATVLQTDHQTLKEINPNLRFKGLTPPTMDSFKIRIPEHLKIEQPLVAKLTELKSNRHTQWKVHKVRQGDTLWSISRFYQIPLSKVLAYNRIRKKSILRIGQKLMLPIPNDWERPKIKSKTELTKSDIRSIPGVMIVHTVQKGDTLWQISQRYSVSIAKIKKWNRRVLRKKYLKVGTEIVLKVPARHANSISM